MQLLKIELRYFRQYKNETIYFPQNGLIGVLGNNGAGKSTLFNAIGWCLYGKIKGVTNSMIKNQSAGKKDECYVILDFLFQGKHYRVRRDLVSSRCFAQVDGVVHAIGTTSLNAYIEEDVFKMDHNAFCTCYYAEQDDFDALVKLNPGPRVATLSKLLRIETIDKAADKARKDYRMLELEVFEAKKHIKDEQLLVETKQEKQILNKQNVIQVEQIDKELSELVTVYRDSLVQKEEGEKDYRTFQQLMNDQQQHTAQIQTLTQHSLQPSEERLQKLLAMKLHYDELLPYKETYRLLQQEEQTLSNARIDFREKQTVLKEIDDIKREVSSYAKEIDELTTRLSSFESLEKDMQQTEATMAKLQQTIDTLTEEIQEISFDGKTKKARYQALKQEQDQFLLLGTGVPCPTCKQELGESHMQAELDRKEVDIQTLIEEMKKLQAAAVKLDNERKTHKATFESEQARLTGSRKDLLQKNKLHERLSLLTAEINKRKAIYQKLKDRLDKVKDTAYDEARFLAVKKELEHVTKMYEKIMQYEEMIKEIDSLTARIEQTKQTIAAHEEKITSLQTALTSLNFNEEQFMLIHREIDRIQTIISTKKEDKSQLEMTIKVTENEIHNIDEKLAENKKILAEVQTKEQEMALLSKLDEVYKGYKTDKLKKLAPALSAIMSAYIETITDGKYDQIELDDKYNIFIYRNGIKNPLEFYSGGEKKLAALCQRLAISELVVGQTGQANFDMLAMDEVLGAMDNDRQDSIMDMLRNLNETFPQILIVAHNEHAKELFDYVLDIQPDKDGFSTVTWTNEWDFNEVKEITEEFDDVDEAS